MIFIFLDRSDLDLWTTDPKIISGHLMTLSNHPFKFEDCRWKGTLVIILRWFSYFMPQWPWLLTYWPQKHRLSSLYLDQSSYEVWRVWVESNSSFHIEMVFIFKVTVTLTFDILTQNPTGIKYLMNPIMLRSVMKFQVIGILKKIEKKPTCRNKLTWKTDGRCNYYIPPFRGIKMRNTVLHFCILLH